MNPLINVKAYLDFAKEIVYEKFQSKDEALIIQVAIMLQHENNKEKFEPYLQNIIKKLDDISITLFDT